MTTILLVDDHPVVRDGYRRLFERRPGWHVVGEAGDAAAAYKAYRDTRPDVVVMDLSLPGPGGLEAVRHIRQWDRRARVLVLTMHANPAFATKAFEAGATGYATKSGDPADLVLHLERVSRGEQTIAAEVAGPLALAACEGSPLGPLSPRETEILRLVASGWTTAEIADAMSLSPKTIHNYHYEVKAKLGARTDAELVHLAMRAGLVPCPID